MSTEPVVEFLHRNHFRPLPGAKATRIRANAWEVVVPDDEAIRKLIRGALTPESFDDAVIAINGDESVQCMGSGTRKGAVVVTVLF